jgi:hypothetical protein
MMLVEPDLIVAETVHLLPRLEIFGIGAHSHVWLEVLARQRIGKLVTNLQVLELFAVADQKQILSSRLSSSVLLRTSAATGRSRRD